jgi:GntR family transcriptional regulator / MocR family aminotransferase
MIDDNLDFELDDSSSIPIYRQIYLSITRATLTGRLRAGTRLPSARSLAAQLGVARGTVEAAYHLLAGEGYVVSRGAAGTRVSTDLRRGLLRLEDSSSLQKLPERPGTNASRPPPALFQMGLPALDEFPQSLWSRLLARQARTTPLSDLSYPDPTGLEALRVQIAGYLAVARGIQSAPEDILITGGYQGALGLMAHSLLRPGDRVWVEDPGYPDSRDAMRLVGADVIGIPVDRAGLRVQQAISSLTGLSQAGSSLAAPKLVLVTPTHHYPSGVTLSLPRRIALLEWAGETGVWIVEDDYDSEFRYTGKPLPALKSLDRSDRVLYAGTFSKVLSPSLRVGYLVVPTGLKKALHRAAALLQPTPPVLVQGTVAAFLEQGHLGRHIRKMRGRYSERRTALSSALREHVSGLRIELQPGGMHLLGQLPKGTDDLALVAHLRERGLQPSALSGCGVNAPHAPGLLLGFTNIPSSAAEGASVTLGEAMRSFEP